MYWLGSDVWVHLNQKQYIIKGMTHGMGLYLGFKLNGNIKIEHCRYILHVIMRNGWLCLSFSLNNVTVQLVTIMVGSSFIFTLFHIYCALHFIVIFKQKCNVFFVQRTHFHTKNKFSLQQIISKDTLKVCQNNFITGFVIEGLCDFYGGTTVIYLVKQFVLMTLNKIIIPNHVTYWCHYHQKWKIMSLISRKDIFLIKYIITQTFLKIL